MWIHSTETRRSSGHVIKASSVLLLELGLELGLGLGQGSCCFLKPVINRRCASRPTKVYG